MTPQQQVPGLDLTRVTWLEATDTADRYRDAARTIRDAARVRPVPRGRWSRLLHAAWMAGADYAAWLLEQHACAYSLHARQKAEEAK